MRVERTGALRLPLITTGPSGAIYRLEDAVFLVKDARGRVVAELATATTPELEVLSTELVTGQYSVALRDGWSLVRSYAGATVTVPAELVSEPVHEVSVTKDEESIVTFAFATKEEDIDFDEGTLGVRISVEEKGACGNGRKEPREACDDGRLNGQPNQCDAECKFQCKGACPLRVDVDTTHPGDGSTWKRPLASIQEAIDRQAALGGGQVWVSMAVLQALEAESLITLREGVEVIGGFVGCERKLSERDPDGRTPIQGFDATLEEVVEPIVVGASRTGFKGFTISQHDGRSLVYEDAEAFSVSQLTIQGGSLLEFADILVRNSSGRFETLSVNSGAALDGVKGILIEDSRVQVTRSEFDDMSSVFGVAGIWALRSDVVLEAVRLTELEDSGALGATPGLLVEESRVFAANSLWMGNGFGIPLRVGDGSEFFGVNTHFERNATEGPVALIFPTASATFLNSSFVENSTSFASSLLASGDGALAVVNATFFDNRGEPESLNIPDDITAGSTAQVANIATNGGDNAFQGGFVPIGSCVFGDEVRFILEALPGGERQVFIPEDLGCADRGSDEAARVAAERAIEFAAVLGGTSPLDPAENWWRNLTSIFPLCEDVGPVDPGRHYARTCEPEDSR